MQVSPPRSPPNVDGSCWRGAQDQTWEDGGLSRGKPIGLTIGLTIGLYNHWFSP